MMIDPPNIIVPSDIVEDEPLDPKILQVIGERLDPDRIFTPAIHKDLAIRIEEIIEKGLPAEGKEALLKKFPLPNNCLIMDPPKLNPEVKACLQDVIIKRDVRIGDKQKMITAVLAGIAKVLSTVLKLNIEEKLDMLESLSGLIRLLAGLHHEESVIRRSLILKNLNLSVREIFNTTIVDEWLFSKDLEDRVKAAKTLESSSGVLKPKPQQILGASTKNVKRPLRRQVYKPQSRVVSSGQRSTTQRS